MREEYRNMVEEILPDKRQQDMIWEKIAAAGSSSEQSGIGRRYRFPARIAAAAESEQSSVGRRHRFPARLVTAAAALTLAVLVLVPQTGLAEELKEILTTTFFTGKTNVSESIQENVYTDEDDHVRMTISEMLCDGMYLYMIVDYEALDEEGQTWIAQQNWENQDPFLMKILEPSEYVEKSSGYSEGLSQIDASDTGRTFSYMIGGASDDDAVLVGENAFYYPMTGETRETTLNVETNMEFVTYALSSEEQLSELFEVKELHISPLSYVIKGIDRGMVESFYDEGSDYGESRVTEEGLTEGDRLLADDWMEVCFYMNDGSMVSDNDGWRLGGASTEELRTDAELNFTVADNELVNGTVDPEQIAYVTIKGVRYDAVRVEE